jgi:hypothetical protein
MKMEPPAALRESTNVGRTLTGIKKRGEQAVNEALANCAAAERKLDLADQLRCTSSQKIAVYPCPLSDVQLYGT